MKHLFLSFSFIALFSFSCLGQSKADSLWTTWNDQSNPDLVRVRALSKYAQELNPKNIDSALFYAQKAYDLAQKNQFDSIAAYTFLIKGSANRVQGEFDKAKNAYSEAKKIAKEKDIKGIEASAMYSLGIVQSDLGNYDGALNYYLEAVELMEGLNDNSQLGNVYNNIGIINVRQGNHEQATINLEKSIAFYKSGKTPDERSSPMNNLAILKTRQGDYSGAIRLYTESLSINEKAENEYMVAYSNFNIATIYYLQKDFPKFYEYTNKSLEIREKLGDKPGVMRCLNNIGRVQLDEKKYDLALVNLEKSLKIAEDLKMQAYISSSLLAIGEIQIDLKQFDLAYPNIERALDIAEASSDKQTLSRSQMIYGYYYKEKNEYKPALNYFNKSLETNNDVNIEITKNISEQLYKIYSEVNNNKLALKNYELFIKLKDSMESQENKQEVIRQEFKYEYDKKTFADSLSFASQKAIQVAKLKQTKDERLIVTIVLIIVFGFSVLLFNRVRLIKKQKLKIEEQNEELNSLNENLEEKVEERTQKIVEINHNLKESDERYTYALEASNDGIWDYNVKDDTIRFSPAIYTMLGYEPYEFKPSREAIYNLLHSDELKIEKRKAHDLFISKNNNDYLLDEYRMINKAGKTVWVQVKGKIVEKDNHNKPFRIVGTHTDITASKLRNQEMLTAILKTEDAERSRISKDIHDGLQQTLTISLLNFNSLKSDLKELPKELKDKFDLGWEYLQKSINESRNVAHTLMPKSIVDYGVLSSCQKLVDDMNKSNNDTEFEFSHNFKSERLPNQQIEITLYRILQEGLNNITKYAKATQVDIQLKDYDDIYMLIIEDDGIGFDIKKMKSKNRGLGFKSMKNRLDAINGHLEIDSVEGEGTTLLVEIEKKTNLKS
ncbi:MAG: hypothetical protein BM564_11475 [Bacteroidetes bacterium MedPE-SWsnd-G2]|nr:MAG: hypothetical protein BM564_11475 [Bacteroidetes bacterium MedPE-SWsnd-G2]